MRVEIVIDVDPYDTNVVGMIRRVRAAVLNRRRVVLPTVDDDGRRGRRHRLQVTQPVQMEIIADAEESPLLPRPKRRPCERSLSAPDSVKPSNERHVRPTSSRAAPSPGYSPSARP